jgi:hypothetical protein
MYRYWRGLNRYEPMAAKYGHIPAFSRYCAAKLTQNRACDNRVTITTQALAGES